MEAQGVECVCVVDPATELLAVILFLWWAEQAKPKKTVLCSDSVAVLLDLRNGASRSGNNLVNETTELRRWHGRVGYGALSIQGSREVKSSKGIYIKILQCDQRRS